MTDAGRSRALWLKRPLCRRYGWAFFDVAVVRWREGTALRDRPVHWAFGWLPDGECEALGVWLEPGDGQADPRRLLEDLRSRGVERIGHLAGTGAGIGQAQDRVSNFEQLEAEQVRAGLSRAIRRHGSFEIEAAVIDFMADALQRAERRLDRERLLAKGRARLDSGMQMASPGL